jgi:hypothetical protein
MGLEWGARRHRRGMRVKMIRRSQLTYHSACPKMKRVDQLRSAATRQFPAMLYWSSMASIRKSEESKDVRADYGNLQVISTGITDAIVLLICCTT